MAEDFGNGVTRTLSALERQFQIVVWQAGKPPLEAELNLMMQADWERVANVLRSEMHSGWLLDPFNSDRDFATASQWSNFFKFGTPEAAAQPPVAWANVNGWIVPVTGTNVSDSDTSNRINLFPPPSTDARIDFVFLEVWMAQVAPNPSTVNKPSASTIYRYGNVQFGGTNIPDDIEDGAIGFETTERVQLQYRLRVVGQGTGLGDSVDLATFTDGLDDPNVLAQGAATAPQTGFNWSNMRLEKGDPGLWRSGDGDYTNALNTVDGYTYAIPLCGVFRRNTAGFVARTNAGNANQNGAMDRNPNSAAIVDPVEGTRIFSGISLTSAIDETATGLVQVDGLASSGFDNVDLDWNSTFLVIDGEVIGISGVNTSVSPGTITIRTTGRGRYATQARPHDAGTSAQFFIFRPDGLAADMVSPRDILDLRKGVTPGEWDYQALLSHNLGKLFENSLRSSFKQAAGSDTEGPVVVGVDTLWGNPATPPLQTGALDGPDGIRTIFSDAATIETAALLLKPDDSAASGDPVQVTNYLAGAGSWGPAPGFTPSGWQRTDAGWSNGAVIRLFIGGTSTNDGARATVRTAADNRFVRFVSPREYWLTRDEVENTQGIGVSGRQTPFMLRFIEEGWGDPAANAEPSADHPGPMYPLPESNFERPFIVLGGVTNTLLLNTGVEVLAAGSVPSGLSIVRFPGLDFDAAGIWYSATSPQSTSLEGITNLLLHGSRNLYDMLTAGGRDRSGASSELYLVLTGDSINTANVGVFRVVGAGTIGLTSEVGAAATDLVVERVGEGPAALTAALGLTAEVRSQYMHTEDNDASDQAAVVLILTDLLAVSEGASSPWDGLLAATSTSQAVLDTTLLYGPSRGAMSRVPDHVNRLGWVSGDSTNLVREIPTDIDANFDNEAGVADGELYFPVTNHIQTWNRLNSQGLGAPRAPEYGWGEYYGESLREAEAFFDAGSKTLLLHPYRRTSLTLNRYQITAGRLFPTTYTLGASSGVAVDGNALFTPDADYAYAFPWEWMPRFGRQDIPYHQTTGAGQTIYPGINHLFGDSQSTTDEVFRMVGGPTTSGAVESLFIQTGTTSGFPYGTFFSMSGPAEGYQGRIYVNVNINSSDVPRGLKGIQLPPFLGIARLYGVYDLREFTGGLGAYESDRVTLSTDAGRPKNLLKTDSDKQTLFIVPGGAEDVTGNADDHTYVVPENLIDVRLSGSYVEGETFDDLEFVVECVVFGFARGFITKNNFILARNTLPDGGDGKVVAPLATSVVAILPLPLPFNDQLYVEYDRTVYQGDPYMTRAGSVRTESDYAARLGQIPQNQAFQLSVPLQQWDSSNNFSQVPEIPNPRALEILASADFYTTLGTGKIGGRVYPGTYLDVAHITNVAGAPTRVPPVGTDPIWQSEVRAFTQTAPENAPRAIAVLHFKESATVSAGQAIRFLRNSGIVIAFAATAGAPGALEWAGASAALSSENFAALVNANVAARNEAGVQALYDGATTVTLVSLLPGAEGGQTEVEFRAASGSRFVTGYVLEPTEGLSRYGLSPPTRTNLTGGVTPPMNGTHRPSAVTPIRMAGLTDRLPLGILLQDADFIGEDPLRDGTSSLRVLASGGAAASAEAAPIHGADEYGRIQGSGQIGMADGSILEYTPATGAPPTGGATSFRLYRGGGSAYVLDPPLAGGPVDWSSGSYPEGAEPVLKGAVLAGRAFLVRNWPETAFSGSNRRSYGDEVQMVVLTAGTVGSGPQCESGYALDGQIGPTGYGEGFCAADRYRLEGKPQMNGHSLTPVDPDLAGELAPFPGEDEGDENHCP